MKGKKRGYVGMKNQQNNTAEKFDNKISRGKSKDFSKRKNNIVDTKTKLSYSIKTLRSKNF